MRRVAFEKILETLLDKPSSSPKKPQRKRSKVKTATAKTSDGKKVAGRAGPKARVEELVEEGFFAQQRTIADVKAELPTADITSQ